MEDDSVLEAATSEVRIAIDFRANKNSILAWVMLILQNAVLTDHNYETTACSESFV